MFPDKGLAPHPDLAQGQSCVKGQTFSLRMQPGYDHRSCPRKVARGPPIRGFRGRLGVIGGFRGRDARGGPPHKRVVAHVQGHGARKARLRQTCSLLVTITGLAPQREREFFIDNLLVRIHRDDLVDRPRAMGV
jgi:hypothetical protein